LHNKTTAGSLFGFNASRLLTINQVHGKNVLIIDKPVKDIPGISKTSADAIITNQYGIAIGILTADCVPILLADPVKRLISAVHAGWRGTAKRIVQKTIEIMINHFDSDKKAILAAIGPSIGQCCYEVDGVVAREFRDNNQYITPLSPLVVVKSKGSGENVEWRLDLKRANLNQLLQSGLLEQNVSIEDICTSCRNDLFFSYRADNKKTGRQLNFIMMRES